MSKVILQEKLAEGKVRCNTCHHRCLVFENRRGLCGVRENQQGELYLLVYGRLIAEAVDPIEKKPLFHFLPGTKSLSIATVGCNFKCQNCQNADISQASKEGYFFEHQKIPGNELSPEKIVQDALNFKCASIAYTYTEPTIFLEYALDTMKLAHQKNLKNVWVSNGYMTPEALDLIAPGLDAINVDLKFFSEELYRKICGARLEPILENLKRIKKLGIWLEVTTLLIPELTDSQEQIKKMADFIVEELDPETPWHISRFFPTYKLKNVPSTTAEMVYQACEVGRNAGLRYVYPGNI